MPEASAGQTRSEPPHVGCHAERAEAVYAWGRQNWFANHATEHRACREAVALFDQSAFTKLRLSGHGALPLLQRLCANHVDVPVGRLVYTALLNERGGFESDLTVIRTGEQEFTLVTGSTQETRDTAWLRDHRQPSEDVRSESLTASHGVLGVMGPRSRELLGRVATELAGGQPAAFDNSGFPFGTARSLLIAGRPVLAARVTYVGELGWELYVPALDLPTVYDALWTAGTDLGVTNAGHYAINSLRLEKGYRAFGAELSPDETPIEAGLGFAVAWDKPGGFLGREALLRRRESGVKKRLALFALEDPAPVLWGSEPILRNGQTVGYTTSGSYGHTVGAAVALGYVRDPAGGVVTPEFVLGGRYEIHLNGVRVPARVSLKPLYDPERKRVLA